MNTRLSSFPIPRAVDSLTQRLAVLVFLTLLLFGLAPAPIYAGGSREDVVGVERFGADAIRSFALLVNDELDRREVNVAIIARAGRPRRELPRGVAYTHLAFIVFEAVQKPGSPAFHTYTVYNLYQGDQGDSSRSYLAQDLTYDFLAGVHERDVAVCVPKEILQRRLIKTLRSPAFRQLHNPNYNLVANPWVDRYDNCVTHALKVTMAAIYETDDRPRIYRNIRAHFQPTRLHLGFFQGLGSHFIADLKRDDADPRGLQTATYDSLVRFLQENGLVQECFKLELPASPSSI